MSFGLKLFSSSMEFKVVLKGKNKIAIIADGLSIRRQEVLTMLH